ncbi:MAG TPA: carboxypeptidase-like regulatory domain-containing protein [Terriglobales bacterium]|nr:carboxypeptidase-like regulatory domain-containing protein [Terriglobales bacterium]
MGKRILACLMLCLAVVAISSISWSQATNTGTVVGVVTDQSNAVVPNATITLTDPSTGSAQTATTNDNGRYIFVNVKPGTYEMEISKSGFATTKVTQISVEVQQSSTINPTLKVGGSSVVVEVTGGAVDLQMMNSTIGNTVTGAALESLPTLGRDSSSFVTMQPGVSPDGAVAGTVVDQASFMLDGGNNSNDMDGSSGVYNPNFGDDPAGGLFSNKNNPISGSSAGVNGGQPSGVMPTPVDSVEEFKVSTTNQTADFNNSSGLEVAIVTKRGTNTWHGSAYEYYLDNNFSGNTWENNQSNPVTPVPSWHRNWFGATIGGPVLPKEVLGGKTYLFFNYQGARWPNSETITKLVPSADMRNGILHDGPNTYDLNTSDPRGIGMNTFVQQMWNNFMPPPTAGAGCGSLTGDNYCDGVNTLAFRANMAIPQNDNFAVVRLDHDFGQKWHLMSSYRYYHLTRATDDQIDIGGFFKGDKLGTPVSLTNRPQVPWFLVIGVTTNVNSKITNDFRYSFLRNWWQWGSQGDPPQFGTLGAALEPFGEKRNDVAAPYNVNTQQTRTRFWNGRDNFFRDDVSMLEGSHLWQFGGQYQRNWNYHQRTDNGGGINYYPVYLLGDSVGSGNVDLSGINPAFGTNPILAREAAAILGIVTDTQQAYTRTGANLTLNPPLTPAFDKVTIPYYNLYFNDTWHLKPSLTITYGLGWALEMPPKEETGKQVMLVGAQGEEIDTKSYLAQRQAAALQGQVFNPQIGFALIPNVAGHPSYEYDPFYHAFSPRLAVAWNPAFAKNTVLRGGYGRIYGRLNGVNLVLGPLLSPGLIQPVNCTVVLSNNTCGASGTALDANNAFRIGTDGTTAPLPAATQTLPQPFFPGVGANAEAATASPTDPKFRPNSVDSIDYTIQHQFSSKVSLEVGGIHRWIHNELLAVNLNSVPYMMTLGGQQFKTAYANIEKAMGCTTSVAACNSATPASTLANLTPQPFFETALAGTGFNCSPSCTAGLVNSEFGNLQSQAVWSLWTDLDQGGAAPGFNFPVSTMTGTGQISSNIAMATSYGHGNYNAAFATVKLDDWKGVTLQNNFTWSKSLGLGGVVQATSGQAAVDPFNFDTQYGPEPSDRRFVNTTFLVYQLPFYHGQQGLLGRLLGGWSTSFVFAAGSGAPLFCNTNTGAAGTGYSGGQDFGSADGNNLNTDANCILTGSVPSASVHNVNGTFSIFGDPSAAYNSIRPLILGYDSNSQGYGQFRGLPYWNLNMGIKKNFRVTERFSAEASLSVNNVLNHNQLLDPTLSITSSAASFGQIPGEGTLPRAMEMGIRVKF